MKKIKFSMFIILSLIFVITGCTQQNNHQHTFDSEYECIDRMCTECGEIFHATKNHEKNNNYSCVDGECINCGLHIKATEEHKKNTNFDCQNGKCVVCEQPIKATKDHQNSSKYNCVDGECTICGINMPASKEHNNSSIDGSEDGECTDCGTFIPAFHQHQKNTQYDCENGRCLVCGIFMSATVSHNNTSRYSCLDGECTICGKDMPATAGHHNSSNDEGVDGICLVCGTLISATHSHEKNNEYDCVDGYCLICGRDMPASQNHYSSGYPCEDSMCIVCGISMPASENHINSSDYDCVDGECIHCGMFMGATSHHEYNEYYECECGANFRHLEFNIEFVDLDGIVCEEYTVNFGDLVTVPTLDVPEGLAYKWTINGNRISNEFYYYYFSDITVIANLIILEELEYTYNTYVYSLPTNWNLLTYMDNNERNIIDYINGKFFEFDYKFDEEGNIIPGKFDVEYSAATRLEDVTSDYVGEEWDIKDTDHHRAYKITLRDDLKWDDGTPINAYDFVYTMKELLNPDFKHYRADSYYIGNIIIHNAENYVNQDSTTLVSARKFYETWDASATDIVFDLSSSSVVGDWINTNYGSYLVSQTPAWVLVAGGYVSDVTEEEILSIEGKTPAEIYANEEYKAIFENVLSFWQTEPNEELDFFSIEYNYSQMSFDQVGLFVPSSNPYELVIILDKPLQLLNEDGSLSYEAAYNFSSLPLVHRGKYEVNKVRPNGGNNLWTSKYNSSVSTTASWGPYKLTSYNSKGYVLEKNPYWYGNSMEEYDGQYQTETINCEVIKDWNIAWLKFKAGEIDGIGIDFSIADEYKGSERAYFTSDDLIISLHLQSSKEALEARESENVNKTILTYVEFRQALSLAIDRNEYNKMCTTSSLAGYGLFNSMHYYDVASGGVYRNEDVAKQVLCDVYGVNVEQYESLDAAYAAITGYNLELARKLVDVAYDKAFADGEIDADDIVKLQFGSSVINTNVTRNHNFIKESWKELVKGTKLEGRLDFEEDKAAGNAWSNDFRAGTYDVCMGGWSGASWDPGYFLLAYLSPDYMYSNAWDTSAQLMEFTMPGAGEDGEDITDTLSLIDWYNCLNNNAGCKYYWGEGSLPNSKRLLLIAALEKEVLSTYYTIPIQNQYSASLISYKVDYITYEYNTFMEFGGIRYLTYNFDDEEWELEVNRQGGSIDYR